VYQVTSKRQREVLMRKWLLLVSVTIALAVIGGVATHAYASSNKQVIGSGSGSVTCTAGGPAFPAEIQFNANLSKGNMSGFVQIFGGAIFKFGNVVSGSVSGNRYDLRGNEDFASCPGAAVPTTFTLGRECGTGVTIEFVAANGQRGAFVGNVACST
jgi:hypothetical protein